MTSRLKRKLDDLEENGINLNESFCQIGTPLPSLADSKKDQNEFVPVWKQEVRDEQGRQRFHGAFTGGFSAGYYNTVGSKEGFTPSTFISSRSNRAKDQDASRRQQTAEDFMDEEDLEDLRNARQLENTETFKGGSEKGKTADELLGIGGSAFLSSAVASMIQPASSSIGAKLMAKLGWRPGQGIGPRVTARKLRIQEAKISGRSIAGKITGEDVHMGGESVGNDDEAKKHTFAPRDTRLLVFDGKVGKEGLGFVKGVGIQLPGTAEEGRNDRDIDLAAGTGGFGLGPEGADEDDADIYGGMPVAGGSSSRMMAYDDMDMDDGEGVILLGGDPNSTRVRAANPKQIDGQQTRRRAKPILEERHGTNHWNDGRPVLAGFELDPSAVAQDKWFDFPSIPDGWSPKPSRVWKKGTRWDRQERLAEPVGPPASSLAPGKRVQLSADQRGEVLGETAPKIVDDHKTPKSVFEYMSEKEKQRLADFLKSKDAPTPIATTMTEDGPIELDADDLFIPPLSPRTASAALKGFIPFGDDQDKQERYQSYLRSQMLNTPTPIPKLFPSKNIDQVNKELSDFSKSASMFRPMSFAMANRFTSSTVSAQDMVQPKPGLHMPDPDKLEDWNDDSKTKEEPKEVLTPRQEAARAGLYGALTRVSDDWAPNKLLCKRFGVQDPFPDGMPKGTGTSKTAEPTRPLLTGSSDVSWQDKFIHQPTEPVATTSSLKGMPAEPAPRQPKTLAEVGLADDENQGKDILTYTKPAMDIFKAIFANDSDDEDEEDSDEDDVRVIEEVDKVAQKEGVTSTSDLVPAILPPSEPDDATSNGDIPLSTLNPSTNLEPYKPVFVPGHRKDTDSISKTKSKKEKKREKTKTKVLMSFDTGELDGDEEDEKGLVGGDRKKEKEKKRKIRERDEDSIVKKTKVVASLVEDEDDEWVEKAAPEVVSSRSGRATAADFM